MGLSITRQSLTLLEYLLTMFFWSLTRLLAGIGKSDFGWVNTYG